MRTVETGYSRSTLGDDGIVTTGPIDDQGPRTGEMVAEILAGIKMLVGSTPRPVLWMPGDTQLEPRGWQILTESVSSVAVAVAIIADDNARVRLGAFPGMADALLLPVRIFAEESAAREWLLTFVSARPTTSHVQTVETELMVVTKEDDGVIVGRERNYEIPRTVDRVEEAIDAVVKLSGRQTSAAMWDMRGSPRPEPESWRLFIGRIPDVFHALAIVVDEGARKALGAFPMAIDNLLVPVRLFEDEIEAREWIVPFVR